MWEKLAQILPGRLPEASVESPEQIRSCPVPVSRPSAALWAVAEGQPLHGDWARPTILQGAAADTRPTFIGKKLRIHTGIHKAGSSVLKMVEVSRHKSVDMLTTYVRRSNLFREHAGAAFL